MNAVAMAPQGASWTPVRHLQTTFNNQSRVPMCHAMASDGSDWARGRYTEELAQVSCKRCLKSMAKRGFATSAALAASGSIQVLRTSEQPIGKTLDRAYVVANRQQTGIQQLELLKKIDGSVQVIVPGTHRLAAHATAFLAKFVGAVAVHNQCRAPF